MGKLPPADGLRADGLQADGLQVNGLSGGRPFSAAAIGERPFSAAERPFVDGRPLAVELFAGTAGATAAFRRHGWNVITVDVDGRHRPDLVADVRSLPLSLGPDVGRPVEFLWSSPPCTDFSDANPDAPLRPSLDLVFAAMAAVRAIRPRFWIIENVRGAIPHLGIPAQKIGPWCLWGYFPQLRVTLPMHDHQKSGSSTAIARAAVPAELSESLYRAIVNAHGVRSLLDLRPFRRHRHIKGSSSTAVSRSPDLFGQ